MGDRVRVQRRKAGTEDRAERTSAPGRPGGWADGRPLEPSVRAFLEPRFGHSFSGVRVHADDEADRLARGFEARALTLGQDVFFREGAYRTGDLPGLRLLAHELAHTVQQGPLEGGLPGGLGVSGPGDAVEHQARAAADAALGLGGAEPAAPSGPAPASVGAAVMREGEDEYNFTPADPEPGVSYPGDLVLAYPEPQATLDPGDFGVGGAEGGPGWTPEEAEAAALSRGPSLLAGRLDGGSWRGDDGATTVGLDGSVGVRKAEVEPGSDPNLGGFGFEFQGPSASAGLSASDTEAHLGAQANLASGAVSYRGEDAYLRAGVSIGPGFDVRLHGGEWPGLGADIGPVSFDYRSRYRPDAAPWQVNDGQFPVDGGPGYPPEEREP